MKNILCWLGFHKVQTRVWNVGILIGAWGELHMDITQCVRCWKYGVENLRIK